ncbi:MAG: ROK family protein [Fretibacterium sp.]|nr:ROK family protein [Fretibacterium sp.]
MIIGVEIGGTKLQAAVGRADGSLIQSIRGRVDVSRGSAGILEWLRENVTGLRAARRGETLDAIGVGFGGPVDSARGTVIHSGHVSGWDGMELKRWFEEGFGVPSFIFNDSSAAGWGEYVLGSGRGTSEFFYTNIGSGIGGSLVVHGQLCDGQGYGAAEIGHTSIPDWTAQAPGAGAKLEDLCSGWAIDRRLRGEGYVPEGSLLMELCGGNRPALDARLLGTAAHQNDPFALEELDRVARGMGMALANVLCLLQPQRIAVGGGVSLIGAPLIDRIREETRRREFISNRGHWELVQCALGEAVVLQGAILLAAEAIRGSVRA